MTGKVDDLNSIYFARELTQLGVAVQSIFIVPDQMETIAYFVKKYAPQADFFFTSGGVGPTHDDITMAAVAQGLERKLEMSSAILQLLKERFGSEEKIPEALRKMALVPQGAKLRRGKDLWFPLVSVENIYIFPGDPYLLRQKFSAVKDLFQGVPRKLSKIYLNQDEFAFAKELTEIQQAHPRVAIGSYPKYRPDTFKVMLTFESETEEAIQAAIQAFFRKIPKEWVLFTESPQ